MWARGKSVTYRELDERSNQLAHLLLADGNAEGRPRWFVFSEVRGIDCQHAGRAESGRSLRSTRSADAGGPRGLHSSANCGIRILITNSDKRAELAPETLEPDREL